MKLAGFLLLLAGWFLVLATIGLLGSPASRIFFIVCGIALEGLGLTFVIRSHLILQEDKR